ncbi:hypothetical protein [Roseovarius sp. D0-M9]|uniref:hypothetical protein n=1 Tax=Roseovarius sp. D0-M9 TaxID=3127117 RepID=UPI00300FAB07
MTQTPRKSGHTVEGKWSVDEDDELTRRYFAGEKWQEIAGAMNRTISSCLGRATTLSLARKKRSMHRRKVRSE